VSSTDVDVSEEDREEAMETSTLRSRGDEDPVAEGQKQWIKGPQMARFHLFV
jgi:hypothetical protein